MIGYLAVRPILLSHKPLVDYILLGIGREALQQVQALLSLALRHVEMIVFSLASPDESDNQGLLLFLCIEGPHRVAPYAPRTRHEVIQRVIEAAFFFIRVSVDV